MDNSRNKKKIPNYYLYFQHFAQILTTENIQYKQMVINDIAFIYVQLQPVLTVKH